MLIWPILPIWADPHSLLFLTAALKVTEAGAYIAALAKTGQAKPELQPSDCLLTPQQLF